MPYLHANTLDDVLSYERFESFGKGMDAFTRATLLPPDAVQYLENMFVTDNDLIDTRPGTTNLGSVAAGAEKIQGLAYYDSAAGTEHLIRAFSQDLHYWDGATWTLISAGALVDASTMIDMRQGVDLMAITDGTNPWWTWDGSSLTALGSGVGPLGDAPVGATLLEWHSFRMFAAGDGANPDTVWASSALDFSNGQWDHTNFSFRVGGGEGQPIRAISSLPDHYLAVLKSNSIWLVNADPSLLTTPSAADWPVFQLTNNLGCVGRRAHCRFGNDLLFLAQDGIRSLGRMSGSGGQFEISPPLSQPMQPYINRINWSAADKTCAYKYREYAFFAVPLDSATEPNYVLVWNGRLRSWMGFWTGWTPVQWALTRFSDVERFVFGTDDGMVLQWLDYADKALAATYQDNDATDVAWKVKLRSSWFGEPISTKDGYHLEVRFVNSEGDVMITLFYDEEEVRSWTENLAQAGATLPVDLPFDLASVKPVTVRKGLDSLGQFNEVYIEISATAGRGVVKNATLSAFLDTIDNE